ncbi:hypothetical protein [Mesorhizobium sp. M0968]|uniref:hypothetical protein n=1 Tax=Mesorhizobium sp. M0968 TaxID=2957037 RepID=UPI003338EB5F
MDRPNYHARSLRRPSVITPEALNDAMTGYGDHRDEEPDWEVGPVTFAANRQGILL